MQTVDPAGSLPSVDGAAQLVRAGEHVTHTENGQHGYHFGAAQRLRPLGSEEGLRFAAEDALARRGDVRGQGFDQGLFSAQDGFGINPLALCFFQLREHVDQALVLRRLGRLRGGGTLFRFAGAGDREAQLGLGFVEEVEDFPNEAIFDTVSVPVKTAMLGLMMLSLLPGAFRRASVGAKIDGSVPDRA